ncbi:MAG: hypothetical protein GXY13_15260, partial [Acidimicrobiales bacterium]|nr:hypothetical protein [Acidimicrobiales bacterium]
MTDLQDPPRARRRRRTPAPTPTADPTLDLTSHRVPAMTHREVTTEASLRSGVAVLRRRKWVVIVCT